MRSAANGERLGLQRRYRFNVPIKLDLLPAKWRVRSSLMSRARRVSSRCNLSQWVFRHLPVSVVFFLHRPSVLKAANGNLGAPRCEHSLMKREKDGELNLGVCECRVL